MFEASSTDAGPPRITLDGNYDASAGQFSLSASAHTAPDSDFADESLSVVFQIDDQNALTNDDISVSGSSSAIPESTVSGTARIHVVAHGEDGVSIADAVEIDADSGTVTQLNDPPKWTEDAIVYEILVRSFAGTEQSRTDFAFLEEKVDYLTDLGVDAVWLTPILEAHTTYTSGGGPEHGYDVIDYFQTAADLRRNGSFESFVESCHKQDNNVIFDLVLNHTAREHPFFQATQQNGPSSKYYDWYDRDDSGHC